MSRMAIERTISIGAILSLVVAALAWANTIDKGVHQNAQAIDYLSERQIQAEKRTESSRAEIRDELKAVNEKLDRLIERGL